MYTVSAMLSQLVFGQGWGTIKDYKPVFLKIGILEPGTLLGLDLRYMDAIHFAAFHIVARRHTIVGMCTS